jgi:hypothetical protein
MLLTCWLTLKNLLKHLVTTTAVCSDIGTVSVGKPPWITCIRFCHSSTMANRNLPDITLAVSNDGTNSPSGVKE